MIATLTMHWNYLKAVLRHKRFVYEEGRKLGLGIWQCLIHDWQKFLPVEWLPYARAFYGSNARKTGKPEGNPAFDRAWLHHQRYGPHHWQYWVTYGEKRACDLGILLEDSGKVFHLTDDFEVERWFLSCEPMPDVYRREMLADWRGANRAYGDMTLADWYRKTEGARLLHPHTKRWVERQLGLAE
jgi:hypothetical protein